MIKLEFLDERQRANRAPETNSRHTFLEVGGVVAKFFFRARDAAMLLSDFRLTPPAPVAANGVLFCCVLEQKNSSRAAAARGELAVAAQALAQQQRTRRCLRPEFRQSAAA